MSIDLPVPGGPTKSSGSPVSSGREHNGVHCVPTVGKCVVQGFLEFGKKFERCCLLLYDA